MCTPRRGWEPFVDMFYVLSKWNYTVNVKAHAAEDFSRSSVRHKDHQWAVRCGHWADAEPPAAHHSSDTDTQILAQCCSRWLHSFWAVLDHIPAAQHTDSAHICIPANRFMSSAMLCLTREHVFTLLKTGRTSSTCWRIFCSLSLWCDGSSFLLLESLSSVLAVFTAVTTMHCNPEIHAGVVHPYSTPLPGAPALAGGSEKPSAGVRSFCREIWVWWPSVGMCWGWWLHVLSHL